MMNHRQPAGWGRLLCGLLFCFSVLAGREARAEEPLKFKAQLIWGTDLEKPVDSKEKIKDLDPKCKAMLERWGKWKNYYQVDQDTIITVPHKGSKITCMSHDCVVEVFHQNDHNIEVHLYGEGKLFQKVNKELTKGKFIFLGGNIKKKDNEAWIVAISLVP